MTKQEEHNKLEFISVKATIQTLFDIGVFDKYDKKDDVLGDNLTFIKIRRS